MLGNAQILDTAGHGPEFKIPSVPKAAKVISRGDWKTFMNVESEGKTVGYFKLPANTEWFYID
ncbi:hypothetical protein OESDEN_14817 [Oesophagostomum dentatum]|uniref:Uncharacterized protein n=1 Tax=Oesophagostomum dentatum TaxID=61180 RepID=A0A0B1SQF8_OESDE|nr:hypothetical protein OESDEN_14817 [Oesophagostomum dentatum]